MSSSPIREKHRLTVLMRGMLLIAVGGLVLQPGVRSVGVGALTLVVLFAVSDLLLLFAPARLVSRPRFDLAVGALDLVLVGLGIHLAGVTHGALPISCLLMVLVVALGSSKANTVAGATAVGAMHAWLMLSVAGAGGGRQLVVQTLFLCAVGLYYGFLAEGIHRLRSEAELEETERLELTTLVDILDAVTSSLDLRRVSAAIVTKLNDVVPSVRCSILYVDEEMTRAQVMASHDRPDLEILEVDLEKYPEIRHAIETRSPVIIHDVHSDPLMLEIRDKLKALDFQSIMVMPITFGSDLLGTLCLKTARARQEFSGREIDFCTAVARASANALKNAVFHQQVVEESRRHRGTSEKLARILNNSPDLILTTDNAGRITEFNRGAERLLGHAKWEVLGERCGILLEEDHDAEALIDAIRTSGVLPSLSCRLRTKSGAEVEAELNMSVLKNEAEEITGTVWIGHDVTELKAAQLQLAQAEKLSTIGEVISGVAHELNNPLSGVLGFSQLVMARHADSPLVRELEKINESALRCQKIVKNLLSFARAHKPERKYLGVNGILEKTLDLRKYHLHVNNIEVVRDLEPDLPCTMLDFHQMQQVFLNLINNAQHAMAAARERPGRLSVRSSDVERTIRVEIADNGEGMDSQTLQRIFDPFFTTKEQGQGTGLGLSVSYGIVKEHGGRIHARSSKGQGSTFVVELPIWKETGQGQQDSPDQPEHAGGGSSDGRHILVVDDEPLVLDLLLDILHDTGHRVDTASNGDEACRKVRSGPYDLVITDIRMPRMDGMDLYRNIMSMRPELKNKVVFITGDLIDTETVRFLADVNARTIPKPLDISKIVDIVHDALNAERTPS